MEQGLEAKAGDVKLIALKQLTLSSSNVRKSNGNDVAELKASIKAQGLLQNLIVCPVTTKRGKPSAKFEVVGGQRRLRALLALAEEGEIAANEGIVCRVMPTRQAAEASLSENYHREPMHPADEFEAFRALVDGGMSERDVAARFGVTETVVSRRLKLARVSPKVMDAYRRDQLSLAQVMAFAVSDDHPARERLFLNLHEWNSDPDTIRGVLTEYEIAATDWRVQFASLAGLHFDHIIPYSKGGASKNPANIQILCGRHNLAKGDNIE